MGMFDDLRCKYPLPLAGANDLVYQTKDTDAQFLDMYEIREDGTLWHEVYDIEDHSERGEWKKQNPGQDPPEGLETFMGCMARVNKQWKQVVFTGEIRFYISTGKDHSGWIEWSAYFVNGHLLELHLIENKQPK